MTRSLLCFLALVPSLCAQSPSSLAGKAYHESGGIPAVRLKWEFTILFGADGRYSFLRSAIGSTHNSSFQLLAPPSDGAYVCTRTGQRSATLTLTDPNETLNVRRSSGTSATLRIDLFFATTRFTHGGAGARATEHSFSRMLSPRSRYG